MARDDAEFQIMLGNELARQREAREIQETAETLLESHGFHKAKRHVRAAIKGDDSRNAFWSRVWDELHELAKR